MLIVSTWLKAVQESQTTCSQAAIRAGASAEITRHIEEVECGAFGTEILTDRTIVDQSNEGGVGRKRV